jgi:hypothetical protein
MLRLEREDFDDPCQLGKLAAAAGVTSDRFRAEFGHLVAAAHAHAA